MSKDVLFKEHDFPYIDSFPNALNSIIDLNLYFCTGLTLTPPQNSQASSPITSVTFESFNTLCITQGY